MAAALILPIAGPYLGTWSALPIGTNNDDGYELVATLQGQEINETDAYGLTLVEAIYRGQNWRVNMRGLEWKTGLLAILQAFGMTGAAGTLTPTLANVGNRWTSIGSAALVLTAVLPNPPTTPQSITAVNAAFAPNSQSAFNLTSKVRELPLSLVLFPYQTVVSSITVSVPFTST